MIDIHIYKNNELLYRLQSPQVPKEGEILWINDSTVYYKVKGANWHVLTDRGRMRVDLVVE